MGKKEKKCKVLDRKKNPNKINWGKQKKDVPFAEDQIAPKAQEMK